MVSASRLQAISRIPITTPHKTKAAANHNAFGATATVRKMKDQTMRVTNKARAGDDFLISGDAKVSAMNVPAGSANSTKPNTPSDRERFCFTSAMRGSQLPNTHARIKKTANIAVCNDRDCVVLSACAFMSGYFARLFLDAILTTLSSPKKSNSFRYWRNSSATSWCSNANSTCACK